MFFSSLALELPGHTNPLYALHAQLLDEGVLVCDLVRGNVTEHGINYPQEALAVILSQAAASSRIYRPHPFGQRSARRAIAQYYGQLGFSQDQILLTPGTSIAYWYCFKLLAEPGDEILCPRPSYPLFEHIAELCGVRLTNYELLESHQWAINFPQMEAQITSRTRAIVVISPHNPTGSVLSSEALEQLADLSERHQLPVISDEVFSEFLFTSQPLPRPAASRAPLVFTLNGFSKMFALPGLKLGWIVVSGVDSLVKKALSALEMICDTFLPVSDLAQFATPEIFSQGKDFLAHYVQWVQDRQRQCLEALPATALVAPQGGFYLALSIGDNEEQAALRLLRDHHILVHPGYFYDIDGNHLVLTFIQEQSALSRCLERIKALA